MGIEVVVVVMRFVMMLVEAVVIMEMAMMM